MWNKYNIIYTYLKNVFIYQNLRPLFHNTHFEYLFRQKMKQEDVKTLVGYN